MPFQVQASLKLANSIFNCDFTNRKLVLIELSGGNDGLNTIIPYNNDIYYNARPRLAITKNIVQNHFLVAKDSSLAIDAVLTKVTRSQLPATTTGP